MNRALSLSTLLLVFCATNEAHAVTAAQIGGCAATVPEQILNGNPGNYTTLVAGLQPGDLLRLVAGTYPSGLSIDGLVGEPDRCIIIEGPTSGAAAVFTGCDCRNTVSIRDSSYVVIRHLELDGLGLQGDAVKAESESTSAHHITLEELYIHDHDAGQQIVGINTKSPTWNWVIRRNVIDSVGTGIYLGNSDGEDEFVNGLIEHNLIRDTLGYNMQLKHQNARNTGLGMPANGPTVIRHNVFSKAQNAAFGGLARPNLLLGHQPLSGPGVDDDTLVYGNFFHQNPTGEGLLQAEGNAIIYDNLFLNDVGNAVFIQPHNAVPKRILIAHNTVVATGTGLQIVGGDPMFEQKHLGNAVFAATPLVGGVQTGNITDTYANAESYLTNPDGVLSGVVDRLDLYPLPGTLSGAVLGASELAPYADGDHDFNGRLRPGTFRGAYAGEGVNPGWLPALERKPAPLPIFSDGFETGDFTAWSKVEP